MSMIIKSMMVKTHKKKELVYKINGLPKKHKCRKDYKSLNWVLKAANNISNGIEGDYPNEKIPGFKILSPSSILQGTRIFNSYNKDLLKKRYNNER